MTFNNQWPPSGEFMNPRVKLVVPSLIDQVKLEQQFPSEAELIGKRLEQNSDGRDNTHFMPLFGFEKIKCFLPSPPPLCPRKFTSLEQRVAHCSREQWRHSRAATRAGQKFNHLYRHHLAIVFLTLFIQCPLVEWIDSTQWMRQKITRWQDRKSH